MEKMIVCNGCSDHNSAKISTYLLNNAVDKVIEGVKLKAKETNTDHIVFVIPKGQSIMAFENQRVYLSEENTITRNDYAMVEGLKGKLPRPFISEEAAIFEDKQVVSLTPYEAYCLVQDENNLDKTRFISVNQKGQSEILEVPLRTTVADIAAMVDVSLDGVKAILLGGIIGKFINVNEAATLEVTQEPLFDSMTIYSDKECMVTELAKIYKEVQGTSCGKCVLCREGALQFMTIVGEMTLAKAKMVDIALIKDVGPLIKIGAYCEFGQKMPDVLLSGMELFASEIESHIQKKGCPAGVCNAFSSYYIAPKKCTGCEECIDSCPEDAIEGRTGFIHMIDEDLCTKCGKCVSACEENAIIQVTGSKPKLPKKLTKVGKF